MKGEFKCYFISYSYCVKQLLRWLSVQSDPQLSSVHQALGWSSGNSFRNAVHRCHIPTLQKLEPRVLL